MEILILIAGVIGGYLLGSLSSAILVCRLFRLPDPRTQGSGNPGTTNVLRLGGRFPAFITLLGDVLKGWLPVFLVKMLNSPSWILQTVLLASVCGHLFPLFFRFKGGKGVATALGGLCGLSFNLGSIFIFTWIGIFALCRYSSLAALIAMASVPIWGWLLYDLAYAVGLFILAAVIIWRHHDNIARLLKGKEAKFSSR